MIAHVYLEQGVLPDGAEYNHPTAENEAFNLSREAFSPWRTQHCNDIWHEKIISHNLRVALVDNIAMHYVNRGVEFPDLIRVGNLGLTHALKNFELEGGSRFSNYASRCIRLYIERAIMNIGGCNGHTA